MARAGPAAARRLDPRGCGAEVRASDLLDVRGRPDGGADLEVPPLRLRRAREPGERPPRVLEGTRVAAPLRDLQGGRRSHGRGAADLPHVWLAVRGTSDAEDPVGGR